MTTNGDRPKLRLDQESLTFRELAEIEETLGAPLDVLFEHSRARPMAALAWIIRRREDPEFSFEDALDLGPGDLEMEESLPEVPSGATTAPRPKSPESGASTLSE